MKSVVCVILIVFFVALVQGCTGNPTIQSAVPSAVATSAVLPSQTVIVGAEKVPTSVAISTETVSVSPVAPTKTLVEFPTATVATTATPTAVPRKWTEKQVGRFISHVGSWIFLDSNLPSAEDEIAQLLMKFTYNHALGGFVGPFEEVVPDELCSWTYSKLEEGYGLVATNEDGVVVEEKTREERWTQFSYEVGDKNKEPYCPQFDITLPIPDFEALD